ncbi:MAG: DNA topoisomerase III [Defluviitaleaceae bacterium]|nr:DNA topoisomerase III [Defluviitaleaceae bacterium]
MHTVIIAEKPSVARDIARVLNCKGKGDGFISGEGHVISWALGHLAGLAEPDDYDPSYKKWRMADLPIIPEEMKIKPLYGTGKQLKLLKKFMNDKETECVICATDSGREGELIFRYIYQWAACKKPVKRLWISSLTDTAIRNGLENMKDGCEYDNLFASARCRSEADWLVGLNTTRALTLRHKDLLPVGRVQTPTLAMLVDRQKEIDAFVSKEYWEVEAQFNGNKCLPFGEHTHDNNGKPFFTYTGLWFDPKAEENKHRLQEKEKAEAIAKKVKNQPGTVESVSTEEKRVPPPQLFDLTELQRECNRKLGFSAQKTLSVAQALYEKHKMITYPRTDSRYLSNDMVPKLHAVIQRQHEEPYKSFAAPFLSSDKLPITNRIVNDAKVSDHHAIIPTGSRKPISSLSPDERAVYDRILRNFIAAFYPAHVYDVTTVVTKIPVQSEEFLFESKGRTEKEAGWTALYAHEREKDPEPPLPPLTEGQAVTAEKTKVLNKKTAPPKPYTEATLLSAMENAGRFMEDESLKEAMKSSGLGTPATRAAIIEKLIASKYAERKKKSLFPTEKGMRLVGIVPTELRSPETTGKWERGLSRIAAGELEAGKFMESIKKYVHYLIESAK